ncbi:transcription factor 25 isoform X1 [Neodiprion fabricii]|uniref:transcription factor 25 isoform X1 n=1 Tax=Neodiprion fabricii TaxID=2872261 RepID=UPI001ED90CA4|nr:transcription factor 25 isoform X1 [Neodiprion fabricii]
MSTRYMKKVYGGDEGLDKDCDPSDVENPVTGGVRRKQFNVFDLLNQNSESEAKEDDDRETSTAAGVLSEDAKRKKKKKKRKKTDNSKVHRTARRSSEDNEEVDDEIERTVREINELLGEPLPNSSGGDLQDSSSGLQRSKENVLTIQHKNLNPYNELKRIFGSKTIQAEQSKRRGRGRSGHLKKTWLVSPRENWPPIGKSGLSMSLDPSPENTKGVQYFIYDHNSSYRQTQMKFLQAVESLNPDNIVAIINAHPYHVDALLQLAELCKLSEDLAMAAELTERALYCLECAFHPLFNVTTANCRLDYKKQQNRALYITLFKHLIFVGGRACYRTSLEFCKMLLSLDPENDPLAIVLAIDFYALRAREYRWFIEFCEAWEDRRNLSQLPNIAYSSALASFHLGTGDLADELLQNALTMFPSLLVPLLDKCGVQTDSRVMGHDFFNSHAKSTSPPALEKVVALYVARSYHLWKEADILPWLERNVNQVLDRFDAGHDFFNFCTEKRTKRYQGKLPKNILRHIILSDIKEITVDIQEVCPETLNIQNQGPVLSHDPLPPADSIDLYTRLQVNPRSNSNNSNLFSLFFTSLFTDIEEDVVAAAANGYNLFENAIDNAGNVEVARDAVRADLRRAVTNLLHEVGNLLLHRAPDGVNDADAEEDTDNDQEGD